MGTEAMTEAIVLDRAWTSLDDLDRRWRPYLSSGPRSIFHCWIMHPWQQCGRRDRACTSATRAVGKCTAPLRRRLARRHDSYPGNSSIRLKAAACWQRTNRDASAPVQPLTPVPTFLGEGLYTLGFDWVDAPSAGLLNERIFSPGLAAACDSSLSARAVNESPRLCAWSAWVLNFLTCACMADPFVSWAWTAMPNPRA